MEVEHGPLEDDCPAETEACFSHFHVKSISLVRVYLSCFGESGPGLLLMDSGRSRGGFWIQVAPALGAVDMEHFEAQLACQRNTAGWWVKAKVVAGRLPSLTWCAHIYTKPQSWLKVGSSAIYKIYIPAKEIQMGMGTGENRRDDVVWLNVFVC